VALLRVLAQDNKHLERNLLLRQPILKVTSMRHVGVVKQARQILQTSISDIKIVLFPLEAIRTAQILPLKVLPVILAQEIVGLSRRECHAWNVVGREHRMEDCRRKVLPVEPVDFVGIFPVDIQSINGNKLQ
jgi:hypothetical protein